MTRTQVTPDTVLFFYLYGCIYQVVEGSRLITDCVIAVAGSIPAASTIKPKEIEMLLLRKSCQEILDANGLSMLHVEIQNKYMCIVGECGKNVVSISGISFSSTRMNSNERAYATQLFAKFITKYIDKLKELIKLRANIKNITKPIAPEFGTVSSENPYIAGKYTGRENILVCKVQLKDMELEFTAKKRTIRLHDYVPYEMLDYLEGILSPYIKKAVDFIIALDEYEKLEEAIKEVEKDIQSCNI